MGAELDGPSTAPNPRRHLKRFVPTEVPPQDGPQAIA